LRLKLRLRMEHTPGNMIKGDDMNVTIMNQTMAPAQAIRDAMDVTMGNLDNAVDISRDGKRFLTLAKLGHWSPFEHASFTFLLMGVSRVTQQQLTRHRMASFSIESQRSVNYSEYVISTVEPPSFTSVNDDLHARIGKYMQESVDLYDKLIESGVPMEDARYVLTKNVTGDIIMTMNARELYHFFKLRTAPAAQWEIREIAKTMFNCLHDLYPSIFNMDILAYAE
jgi:thymidylate synthase (FAD)